MRELIANAGTVAGLLVLLPLTGLGVGVAAASIMEVCGHRETPEVASLLWYCALGVPVWMGLGWLR